jgi:hypothetical protein
MRASDVGFVEVKRVPPASLPVDIRGCSVAETAISSTS